MDDTKMLGLISNAQRADSELFDRMDKHQELIDNKFKALTKWDGTEVPDIFQVVVPEASLFFSKVCSMIAGANIIPEVDGDMDDDSKQYIVQFAKDIENEASNLRMTADEWPLFSTHVAQVCGQGWTCRQILCRKENGVFIPDIRPIDRRWLVYGTSRKGLQWACAFSRRTKWDILAEYDKEIDGDYGVVQDVWTPEENAVFVIDTDVVPVLYTGSKQYKVFEQENPYGFVPFVIQAAPVGSPLRGETVNKGQSIFWPHEGMFEEINFNASIAKTQSFEDLRPSLQQIGDKNAEPPESYPNAQSVISVDQEMKLMPKRDLTLAQKTYIGIIDSMTQRAGMTAINYGNVAFPLPAVAIARLMAAKDSLLYPRLQALALLLQNSHKMIIKQIQGLGKIKLGMDELERTYDVSKLVGAYTMKYRFMNESLEELASKVAIGNSAIGLLSKRSIRKDILMRENPEYEDDQLEQEEAETITPENKIISQIMSYAEMQTMEADAHVRALLKRLEQHFAGTNPLQANQGVRPNQQLPIFSGGGGGGQTQNG